jgi:hypoxanthine phosphoribosyltransferase
MQATDTPLPELDFIGLQHVAAPVRWAGNRAIAKTLAQFAFAFLQPFATWDDLALLRDPGTDLVTRRTRREIGFRVFARQFGDAPAHGHLVMALCPQEHRSRFGCLRQFLSFAAFIVGEELEAAIVQPFQEHGARAGSSVQADGGQGHSIGFGKFVLQGIAQPRLKQFVGMARRSVFRQGVQRVAHTQITEGVGREIQHAARNAIPAVAANRSLRLDVAFLSSMAGVSGVLEELDRVLLSAEAIGVRVAEMAAEIERDYAGKTPIVIALMDGALFFVADLLRHLNLPLRLITLAVSSYHGSVESSGEVRLQWPADLDLRGQDVILVDDILDTGLTLTTLHRRLLAEEPASLRLAVLLDKRRPRQREVSIDYRGFEIEDAFVVGYGLDYQGRFRNLPCIGVLNP